VILNGSGDGGGLETVLCQSGTKSGLGGRQVGLVGSATKLKLQYNYLIKLGGVIGRLSIYGTVFSRHPNTALCSCTRLRFKARAPLNYTIVRRRLKSPIYCSNSRRLSRHSRVKTGPDYRLRSSTGTTLSAEPIFLVKDRLIHVVPGDLGGQRLLLTLTPAHHFVLYNCPTYSTGTSYTAIFSIYSYIFIYLLRD